MAKTSIAHGREIDKLRSDINNAVARCARQAERLTKAGVQDGHVHFKTDRPNTMFVLEPSVDGRRRYVHVGTDTKRQAVMRAAVDRWETRARLQSDMAALSAEVAELDRAIDHIIRSSRYLRDRALSLVKNHCGDA